MSKMYRACNSRCALLAFAALLVGGISVSPAEAVVLNPPCGSTVTSNVILTMDITCTDSTWITIGADNITVDLNGKIVACTGPGYQLSCQEDPPLDDDFGVDTNRHHNIRIISSNEDERGVIKGFVVGVWVRGGSYVKVNGLTVTGPH